MVTLIATKTVATAYSGGDKGDGKCKQNKEIEIVTVAIG